MKARRRIVVALAGSVALLIFMGAFALSTMFPPSKLTPIVRNGLSRAFDAPVALARAELRFVPQPAVRLEGVVIGDPRGYRRPRAWPRGGVAEAKAILANLNLGALLSHKISLTGLTFEDARLTLVRNEDGLGNWEGLLRRQTEQHTTPSFQLSLDGLALAPARFSFYDARDGGWFDVHRLEGKIAFNDRNGGRDRRIRFVARASGLGGRTQWPIGGRPIELSADLEGKDRGKASPDWSWTLKQAALKRGALALTGKGTIEGPEQVLAFKLDQTRVPLAALLELLPKDQQKNLADLDGTGTVQVGLVAQGPMAHGQIPHVRARATMAGGGLSFRQRALAVENLAFDVVATEVGADVPRLSGRVGRSVFEASGKLRSWSDPRIMGHLKANTDLAEVGRFLPLPDSTRLSGRADLDVDGAGPPGRNFGWSGRVVLANVAATGLGLGYPVNAINGTIGLTPGKAWATGLSARLGKSDVTVDGTVDRPLEFLDQALGRAKTRDPGAVARFALTSNALDGDELFPARKDNSAMPRVRAEGSFKVGAFKLQKFAGRNLAGRLVYQDGVTSVSDIVFDSYGGRARGTAWFDFNDRVHPRYQVHGTAEQVDANQLFSAWTPAKNIAFGTLQMTIDLDGVGLTAAELRRSLSAKGIAQLLGGKLAGASVFSKLAEFTGVDNFRILSFRDLSAPFHITSGRVVFDPLAITSGQTDWLAKGSLGLDGTLAFDVAALIPPNMVPTLPQKLARVAGAALDPSGRLTLDLTLRGTVSRPVLEWDSERTLSRLLERGPESLLAIVQGLGGSLQDSIQTGRSTIDALAGALFDAQRKKLGSEVAQEKESQSTSTLKQLEDLFTRRPAAPPPPVADSTQAAQDTTHAAPPPPPAPLPATGPPGEPVLTPGPPDSTTAGSAGAPAGSTGMTSGAPPGAPLTAPATKSPPAAPLEAPLKGLLDLLKKKPPPPPPDTTARG